MTMLTRTHDAVLLLQMLVERDGEQPNACRQGRARGAYGRIG